MRVCSAHQMPSLEECLPGCPVCQECQIVALGIEDDPEHIGSVLIVCTFYKHVLFESRVIDRVVGVENVAVNEKIRNAGKH